VVEHGRTGLLAASGDQAALAGLAREMILDTGKRARMSKAAGDYVASERSLEATVARLQALLLRIPAVAALGGGAG